MLTLPLRQQSMTTDISFLTDLKPGLACEETRKLFHGKYLYRLSIHAPCSRYITTKASVPIEEEINKAKNIWLYSSTWWAKTQLKNIVNADLSQLENLRGIYLDYKGVVKFRLESPYVHIYTSDINHLKIIVARLRKEDADTLHSFSCPRDSASEKLLKKGYIVTNNPVEYKYKVLLRDGEYTTQVKNQLISYLESLGDTVKYSKGFDEYMRDDFKWMYGRYFYTTDPTVVTFIGLIHPTIVLKIHELVEAP